MCLRIFLRVQLRYKYSALTKSEFTLHSPSIKRQFSRSRPYSTIPTPQPINSINAPSHIPLTTRSLHTALLNLERDAINYVPLSRIKLALRSLETPIEDTVIRIAILSIGSIRHGKRLARCLLADVLDVKAEWESLLEDDNDARSIILRYGEGSEKVTYNSAFRDIYVPSELLKNHKIELVLSTLNVDQTETTLDRLLVPRLDAQIADTEAFTSVTYPVHKTLLLAPGWDGLLTMGRLLPPATMHNENIKLAIQTSDSTTTIDQDNIAFVDLDKAEQAIQELRSSTSNAHEYQIDWTKSHLSGLRKWLIHGTDTSASILKRPIETYIAQLLVDTLTNIRAALQKASVGKAKEDLAENSTLEIAQDLQKLSERAHAEIQEEIEIWIQSALWSRLKWWKLFWRIDDVEIIVTDLTHQVLRQAEKELIFISGQVKQAGLMQNLPGNIWITIPQDPTATSIKQENDLTEEEKFTKPSQITQELFSSPAPTVQPLPFLPYPQHIRIMRDITGSVLVPELQRYAQSRMLTFLSTTSISVALSSLLYISSPAVGIYGAGSIAALGTVYALQRLQSRWEQRREDFLQGVSQSAIAAVTDGVKTLFNVMESGRQVADVGSNEETKAIEKADRAVKEAEEAISRIGSQVKR